MTPPTAVRSQVTRVAASLPVASRGELREEQLPLPALSPEESIAEPSSEEHVPVPATPQLADENAWTLTGKVHLAPAELEETDLAFPINLATALRLAERAAH